MLETLSINSFKLGDVLLVQLDGGSSYPLKLETISAARSRGAAGRRDPFSLVFSGSRKLFLSQGCHRVSHETLGTFELFLVPVVPFSDDRFYYEACFN